MSWNGAATPLDARAAWAATWSSGRQAGDLGRQAGAESASCCAEAAGRSGGGKLLSGRQGAVHVECCLAGGASGWTARDMLAGECAACCSSGGSRSSVERGGESFAADAGRGRWLVSDARGIAGCGLSVACGLAGRAGSAGSAMPIHVIRETPSAGQGCASESTVRSASWSLGCEGLMRAACRRSDLRGPGVSVSLESSRSISIAGSGSGDAPASPRV